MRLILSSSHSNAMMAETRDPAARASPSVARAVAWPALFGTSARTDSSAPDLWVNLVVVAAIGERRKLVQPVREPRCFRRYVNLARLEPGGLRQDACFLVMMRSEEDRPDRTGAP